ncbi:MAG TPA: class C sortase [Candidatus Olsenella pullicola]|nr:class C sortase [Candidatus Olsenella pullicola]
MAAASFLIGLACIAYPFVSDAINQSRERSVIEATVLEVQNSDEPTLAAEREKAVTYNQQLLDGRAVVTDPFDPDAERPTDEDYDNVLNLSGDGVMATINIPKIHVELPVYHTTDSDVLEHGVGHLEGTSVPIGGESTHCVLSGHTGLPSMKIFDNLDQLEVGDYFVISVLGEDHAYEVTSVEVVLPDETDSLVIEQGRDLCTLVTCTPYGINSHRLLVHAERCEVPAEWLDKGEADFPSGYVEPPDKALLPSVLLGLLLAALVIGGYVLISKLRSRGRAVSDNFSIPTGEPKGSPAGKHFARPGSGSPRASGGGAVGMRSALPRRRTRDGRGRRRG